MQSIKFNALELFTLSLYPIDCLLIFLTPRQRRLHAILFRAFFFFLGSGRIFLFGNNDYGQLGFGHTKVVNKPSCLKYLKPFHSTHVACGKGHTIISTACGRVFAFGYNADGQLGLGDLSDRLVPQLIATDIGEDSIVAVSAGCHHSAFLTGDSNNIYV